MNHEIRRARDRLQTLTPIIEEKSFISLGSLRTPSPDKGNTSQDKAKDRLNRNVRLPAIADVEEDEKVNRPRPSRKPSELDTLINGYLGQTVQRPEPAAALIGYDPTLFCKCCEPINNVSQARVKEFSSGLLSPAEEPDSLGHYKAKNKSKRSADPHEDVSYHQRRGTKAGSNQTNIGRNDAIDLQQRQTAYYSNKNARSHQPFHAVPANYSQNYFTDIDRYVHNPRIYVDTSKAPVPASFRIDRTFPQPETPPMDQRRFDMQNMNTVMDAAAKFDNSMQALEGTIQKLRSNRRITIDETENTYHHFNKSPDRIF